MVWFAYVVPVMALLFLLSGRRRTRPALGATLRPPPPTHVN